MNQDKTGRGILKMPSFYHPAFECAHRFIIDEYNVPEREICIFLPCAMKKPYSQSPSHRVFDRVIFGVLRPGDVHLVVFGTCGVIPRELELMYPFTHYRFMLGRVKDPRVKRDFLTIETNRLVRYLRKTETNYKHRIAYCLGDFREAMKRAVQISGIEVLILPSDDLIRHNMREEIYFKQGSLHMKEYLDEFEQNLSEKFMLR